MVIVAAVVVEETVTGAAGETATRSSTVEHPERTINAANAATAVNGDFTHLYRLAAADRYTTLNHLDRPERALAPHLVIAHSREYRCCK